MIANDALVQTQVNTASEESALLIQDSDAVQAKPVHRLSKRGGVLKLMVLLSVIAIVTGSAFWVAGTSILDMRPASTKKMSQVVPLRKGIDLLTVQPSVQVTNMPTVQPSVQATNLPTAQPSTSIPAPVATPTSSPPVSYEADAPQNTLANGAKAIGCGTGAGACYDGYRVGYIGLNSGEAGTLQFNHVDKNVGGRYTLTIHYMIAGKDTFMLDVSVNGGSAAALNVPQVPSFTAAITTITITLNAGNNTIEFSNPSNAAPDIDRIVV